MGLRIASAAPLRTVSCRSGGAAVDDVDAAHAGLRGERHECRLTVGQLAFAQVEASLGQHGDAAPFGGFVGERGELRRIGQLLLGHARCRQEGGRLAIAEGDGPGLVEQQHVDVAGRLDGATRGRDHVGRHHAAHAGHADRRQQCRRWSSGSGTPAGRSATVIVTGWPSAGFGHSEHARTAAGWR